MQQFSKRGPANKLIWNEKDAARLAAHGYRLARTRERAGYEADANYLHRATLQPLLDKLTNPEEYLAKQVFRRDPLFLKVEAIIKQQREYGWAGAFASGSSGLNNTTRKARPRNKTVVKRT